MKKILRNGIFLSLILILSVFQFTRSRFNKNKGLGEILSPFLFGIKKITPRYSLYTLSISIE